MIIESAKREPVLFVHYKCFDESKDEALHKNSARLAKKGAFTTRTDIPRYRFERQGDSITSCEKVNVSAVAAEDK